MIDSLDAIDRDATAIAAGLDEREFNWTPDAGRSWSIGQCFDHLARGNSIYLEALAKAARDGRERGLLRRGPFRADFFGGLFAKSLEPPVRFRLRTWRVMVPESQLDRERAVAAFLATQRDAKAQIAAAQDLDLNRIHYVNPFLRFLRIRLGVGFLVIIAHDRRHLWQARRVRAHPGFPGAP